MFDLKYRIPFFLYECATPSVKFFVINGTAMHCNVSTIHYSFLFDCNVALVYDRYLLEEEYSCVRGIERATVDD
jgi:hypothetical protein